jgi:hypothetical protein
VSAASSSISGCTATTTGSTGCVVGLDHRLQRRPGSQQSATLTDSPCRAFTNDPRRTRRRRPEGAAQLNCLASRGLTSRVTLRAHRSPRPRRSSSSGIIHRQPLAN